MFVVARAPQIVSGLPRFEMLRRYVHANCFVCRCMEVLQRFVLSWDIWNLVFVHFVGIGWLGFPVPCCFLTAGELHVFARTAIALSGETPKTAGRCGFLDTIIWPFDNINHDNIMATLPHPAASCELLVSTLGGAHQHIMELGQLRPESAVVRALSVRFVCNGNLFKTNFK